MLNNQNLPEWIRIKECKKIITRDLEGKENGFLVDILNRHDDIYKGREDELFQQVYYTSVYRGMFKGFHIHPYKYDTVTCVFGQALLVFYPDLIAPDQADLLMDLDKLLIVPLDTKQKPYTVSFPSMYPHGYFGVSDVSYVLNYRNPAWDPGDKHQYDHHCEGIEEYLDQWVRQHESC